MVIGMLGPETSAPTNATSLSGRAYESIKERILTSQLRPGDLVAAHTLAGELGMSRSPVAQALTALTQEGWVRVVPRVGYVISAVTVADVQEIFQLRFHIEGLGAELAADRATPGDIERFAETDRQVRALARAVPAGDPSFVRQSIDAHTRFHLMVAGLAGNRRLVELVRHLLEESQRVQSLDPHLQRHIGFLVGAHRDVVDALAAGDPKQARAAMQNHIRSGQQRVLSSLVPGAG